VATGIDLSDSAYPAETGPIVPGGTQPAWFLTGVVMINCSLVYLIVLGDLSARALINRSFNGSLASRALVIHLVVAGSMFVGVALLGGLIVHRHTRRSRFGR
jgi:hypothetical protein